ncbi:glutathione S-transferase [Noviherbaspirillum agri]
MIVLHEFPLSGNCHKVRLLLSLLDLPYQSHAVNAAEAEHKSAPFLEMNPFGQVPVLVDGDTILRDSQAILVYLAGRYGNGYWLPKEPAQMAQIIAWLSTTANEVSRGPGALRMHYKFDRQIDMAAAENVTAKLFAILEHHLSGNQWLVLGHPTIADIAVYSYVALSPEGRVDLDPYPAIRAWLARIQSLPGYVGMPGMTRMHEAAEPAAERASA